MDPALQDVSDDLREQHPELRPVLVPPSQVDDHMRSRRLTAPGSYEWWQVEGFTRDGTGFTLTISNGDPFDVERRTALRTQQRRPMALGDQPRPRRTHTVRLSVFKSRRLVQRVASRALSEAFEEHGHGRTWQIRVGPSSLESTEDGWRVRINSLSHRTGIAGLLRPGPISGAQLTADLRITRRFECDSLQRASMPDAPSGATHDWFIAAPGARVSGEIEWSASDAGEAGRLDLDDGFGSVEHFWGSGIFGDGIRRWYRARMSWEDGAAFTEVAIIKKYIQVAGTLMVLRPGEPPLIHRCGRPRSSSYQRSAWLLAYPVDMQWTNETVATMVRHHLAALHDASPCRAMSVSDATFEEGIAPDEVTVGPVPGVFEVFQPNRLHWRAWRPWVMTR